MFFVQTLTQFSTDYYTQNNRCSQGQYQPKFRGIFVQNSKSPMNKPIKRLVHGGSFTFFRYGILTLLKK